MTTPSATGPNGLPLSTDIEAMQRAQPIFDNALEEVTGILSPMTTLQDTLAANWQGETASAFGQAVEQFIADLNKMQGALTDITSKMSQNTGIVVNANADSDQIRQAFGQGLSSIQGLPALNGQV